MSEIISVSNAAELYAALSAAQGGERIELAGGDYGKLNLSGLSFASTVTLVSADAGDPAVVRGLSVTGSSHLALDGIRFDYVYQDGQATTYRPFQVTNSSYITIRNSVFDGDQVATAGIEGEYGTGFGLRVSDSQNVEIENNEFFDFWKALSVGESDRVEIVGNDIHSIRSDGINFASVSGLLIEGNHIHDFLGNAAFGDHRDMIQSWTTGTDEPSTDIVIRGNFLDAGDGNMTQSIFLRNEEVDTGRAGAEMFYRNITITDNVIYNAHVNGIVVGETNGLTIDNNTLLFDAAAISADTEKGRGAPYIRVATGSTDVAVTDNILHKAIAAVAGWTLANNLLVQNTDPNGATWYGKLFLDALAWDADLVKLRAIESGLVDSLGVGARMTRDNITLDAGRTGK